MCDTNHLTSRQVIFPQHVLPTSVYVCVCVRGRNWALNMRFDFLAPPLPPPPLQLLNMRCGSKFRLSLQFHKSRFTQIQLLGTLNQIQQFRSAQEYSLFHNAHMLMAANGSIVCSSRIPHCVELNHGISPENKQRTDSQKTWQYQMGVSCGPLKTKVNNNNNNNNNKDSYTWHHTYNTESTAV